MPLRDFLGWHPWERRAGLVPQVDFLGWHLWSAAGLGQTRGQDLGAGQLGACSVVVGG